ncbi:MAG: hypothetical protein R2932_42940 [Caldilineaceae bacterium]
MFHKHRGGQFCGIPGGEQSLIVIATSRCLPRYLLHPRCQQAADPLALAEYAQQRAKREQRYAQAVRAFLHDLIRLRRRLPRLDQFPFENHAPIHDWQRGQAAQQNEAVCGERGPANSWLVDPRTLHRHHSQLNRAALKLKMGPPNARPICVLGGTALFR